jgi:hypothetical protein
MCASQRSKAMDHHSQLKKTQQMTIVNERVEKKIVLAL